jgi:hypothetical protein
LVKEAVRAVSDSIRVVSSTTYMRFYERTADGEYKRIPPDVADKVAAAGTPALNAVKARGNAMGGLTLPMMPA